MAQINIQHSDLEKKETTIKLLSLAENVCV